MSVRVLLLAPVLAGALACRDGVAPDGATVVSRVAIAANPNNVLSAVLSFSVRNADSVRARYSASGDSGTTPFYSVKGDAATITIVGLRPSSRYAFALEALGREGAVLSAAESTTTGALPVEIRSLHLASTGAPSEPYTLVVPIPVDTTTDAAGYVLVFDAAGEIRWYRRFPGVWPIEAKQQRNGHITVYVGRSFGWQPVYGHFEELSLSGDVVRTYAVTRPYYTDPHELLLSFADTTLVGVHMLGYELKSFDLSAVG